MAMVDRPLGCEDYDGDHRHLVDMRGMTTRRVGVAGRAEDESGGMGGGEGGCGLQAVSLGVASLREFEAPSC